VLDWGASFPQAHSRTGSPERRFDLIAATGTGALVAVGIAIVILIVLFLVVLRRARRP